MTKVLVSFDDALLRRIDRAASSRGLTRSAYLAELAAHDVGVARRGRAHRALETLDELFANSPAGDSTAVVRADRDAR